MADRGVVRVSIESMPEVLAMMRRELAKILRREADLELDYACAQKLRTLANAFEAGLGPLNDDVWRVQPRG